MMHLLLHCSYIRPLRASCAALASDHENKIGVLKIKPMRKSFKTLLLKFLLCTAKCSVCLLNNNASLAISGWGWFVLSFAAFPLFLLLYGSKYLNATPRTSPCHHHPLPFSTPGCQSISNLKGNESRYPLVELGHWWRTQNQVCSVSCWPSSTAHLGDTGSTSHGQHSKKSQSKLFINFVRTFSSSRSLQPNAAERKDGTCQTAVRKSQTLQLAYTNGLATKLQWLTVTR